MQQCLFDAADAAARGGHTRTIDSLDEFEAFFTPKNDEKPEIHGGFAYCHFVEAPEMDEKLKALKVTIRCVPLERRGRTRQVHLHRPAEHQARRVREGVLMCTMRRWRRRRTTRSTSILLRIAHGRHSSSRAGAAASWPRAAGIDAALDWARERIEQRFGPIALVSDAFDFTETDYYAATMGAGSQEAFLRLRAADRSGRAGRHQTARQTPGRPSMLRWAGTPSRGR